MNAPRFTDEADFLFKEGATNCSTSRDMDNRLVMVDISPGVKAPLRRIQETMQAVANDYFLAVSCCVCSSDFFCIADVSWFICPACKTINPMQHEHEEHHGLGMAFTADTLMAMQTEVAKKPYAYSAGRR